jgi:hypothetical protein
MLSVLISLIRTARLSMRSRAALQLLDLRQAPDLREHASTARRSPRVRPFPRDELPVPAQQRIWSDDRGDLAQPATAQETALFVDPLSAQSTSIDAQYDGCVRRNVGHVGEGDGAAPHRCGAFRAGTSCATRAARRAAAAAPWSPRRGHGLPRSRLPRTRTPYPRACRRPTRVPSAER